MHKLLPLQNESVPTIDGDTLLTPRTMLDRPFKRCGIDYIGSIRIASRKRREVVITKAHASLFVCSSTRAIHLKLVSEASSAQFSKALRRMVATLGSIAEIWSDNGTNFFHQQIKEREKDLATNVETSQHCCK